VDPTQIRAVSLPAHLLSPHLNRVNGHFVVLESIFFPIEKLIARHEIIPSNVEQRTAQKENWFRHRARGN
jgi:hypothetical protein